MNDRPGSSALWKILLVLGGVVLAACVVSPLIYWTVGMLVPGTPLEWLADFPFHRYFSRTAQVTALLAVVPTLFWVGVWRPSELGLAANRLRWRDLGAGFVSAALPAAAMGFLLVGLEYYRLRKNLDLTPLARIALTAGAVSVIEEFLFRGVLLGLAVRAWGATRGALFSAAAFAVVHFLRPAKAATEQVTWASGFAQVGAIVEGLPPPAVLFWGLVTLFCAGLLLAGVTLRTRSLWLAIGLHAGWIFCQQTVNALAKFRGDPPGEFLPAVGPSLVSGAVPTGLLPLAALGAATLLAFLYLRFARRELAG